ncbi:hypothetical protein LTR37_003227 [Vermiconidia calcicola]|uniref:Uncharacterized protein n=1 Tax=Vermiconidia calcicola TaxID=1690605 RepID=A0ACC3NR60_9PEZI|nr:hypothetical protein LTR37_003227 [Vermiconidia calcicola]
MAFADLFADLKWLRQWSAAFEEAHVNLFDNDALSDAQKAAYKPQLDFINREFEAGWVHRFGERIKTTGQRGVRQGPNKTGKSRDNGAKPGNFGGMTSSSAADEEETPDREVGRAHLMARYNSVWGSTMEYPGEGFEPETEEAEQVREARFSVKEPSSQGPDKQMQPLAEDSDGERLDISGTTAAAATNVGQINEDYDSDEIVVVHRKPSSKQSRPNKAASKQLRFKKPLPDSAAPALSLKREAQEEVENAGGASKRPKRQSKAPLRLIETTSTPAAVETRDSPSDNEADEGKLRELATPVPSSTSAKGKKKTTPKRRCKCHPPLPPHRPFGYMLYRNEKLKELVAANPNVSSQILQGRIPWKKETEQVRQQWNDRGAVEAAEHDRLYPEYDRDTVAADKKKYEYVGWDGCVCKTRAIGDARPFYPSAATANRHVERRKYRPAKRDLAGQSSHRFDPATPPDEHRIGSTGSSDTFPKTISEDDELAWTLIVATLHDSSFVLQRSDPAPSRVSTPALSPHRDHLFTGIHSTTSPYCSVPYSTTDSDFGRSAFRQRIHLVSVGFVSKQASKQHNSLRSYSAAALQYIEHGCSASAAAESI